MVPSKDATSSSGGPGDVPPTSEISARLDAGAVNCATLILNVRRAMTPLEPGQILEVVAYDPSADLDLRAWSRMTGNALVGARGFTDYSLFYLRKGRS